MIIRKILDKIENKRKSEKLIWRLQVFLKDACWKLSIFIKCTPFTPAFLVKIKDFTGLIVIEFEWYAEGFFNLPKEHVILYSSTVGFFSNFIGVLGYLDFCEKKGYEPRILFNSGCYLEPEKGLNWWEYYFEKVSLTGKIDKDIRNDRKINYLHNFSNHGRRFLSRAKKNEILKKYIRVKKDILNEVNNFVSSEFKDFYILGCHIRGTDKETETGYRYSIKTITQEIDRVLCDKDNYRIFLATDDERYYSELKKIYKDKIISRDHTRLNEPIHKNQKHQGYLIGKEVLIDCLILSRCKYFIGSISNVSYGVLAFNPAIKYKIIKNQ